MTFGQYGLVAYKPGGYFGWQRVRCPILDDSLFDRSTMTTLNVHGYDGSNSTQFHVTACVKYYGGYGLNCGTTAWSGASTTGWVTVTPDRSILTTYTADWPYLVVGLNGSGSAAEQGGLCG